MQRSSSCHSLAKRQHKESRAKCGVCVANRPTTHSTNHLFHDSGLSCKRATVQTVPWLGRATCCVTCGPKGFAAQRRPPLGQNCLNLSRFNTQFAPIVMEAICAKTGSLSGGALFTETRIPVETHLMSNFSFVRSALSRSVHRKIACALFQDLLSGAVSSLALTMSLDSKRGPGQCVECPAAPCHVHVEWRFH